MKKYIKDAELIYTKMQQITLPAQSLTIKWIFGDKINENQMTQNVFSLVL